VLPGATRADYAVQIQGAQMPLEPPNPITGPILRARAESTPLKIARREAFQVRRASRCSSKVVQYLPRLEHHPRPARSPASYLPLSRWHSCIFLVKYVNVHVVLEKLAESPGHAMDAPDPVTAIQFRMEQQGLKRKDLEPLIGSRARVSEVLTRKRNLTLDMVRRVRCGLGISADLLIGPTPVKERGLPVARTAGIRTVKQARKRA